MKKDYYLSKFHIRRDNDKGAAMIVAIIIMTILIVFTFSLTLIAYTLYASQTKNISSMRCSEAANSLSKALGDELTYSDEHSFSYPEFDSYLYKYLRYNICQDQTWPYYVEGATGKHSKENAVRYFDLKYNSAKPVYDNSGNSTGETVKNVEGLPGRTEVAIYWMLPKGYDSGAVGDTPSTIKKKGIRLFIEVTCESASQSYTVKNEYVLDTGEYTYDEDMLDETQVDYYRHKALTEAQLNEAVNPCKFELDKIDDMEKWTWKRVVTE